ncbi:MAG TPA: biopolymer transporter ExbD [Sandaracinaceae bacterium LLY-WYZ-13_1]|nr:biopolymer transporter ExbD [Sandaracinaceae bacterium LLY-WYZ-13_1]
MPELTPQQRAYIRKRTAVHEPDPSEHMGELNIVPFLDIVVNIIIFLLATTEAVLAIAQLDAQLPQLGRRVGRQQLDDGSSSLNLSVTVTNAGVIVSGSGGKLAPGCADTQTGRVITVPQTSRGTFDWDGLTQCASRVKQEFPDETQVILSADPEIQFEAIVNAMDALRGEGPDPLFPDVMLSAGVR